jgi:hypothetical protein
MLNLDIKNWKYSTEVKYLFLFYLVSHGGILFLFDSIYWDDWTLYVWTNETIIDIYRQAGFMFNVGYLHTLLLPIGVWTYKILTFLLLFISGLFLNLILKRHSTISKDFRFFTTLLFLCLPLFWARVAIIDFQYVISYFLFFLAWLIIEKYRVISLIFFFISFNTQSLLVFSLIPFCDLYYRKNIENISLLTFRKFIIQRIDFAFLPFLFFLIKNIFFKPYGNFIGYNEQFSLGSLFLSVLRMGKDFVLLVPSILFSFFIFFIVLICFHQGHLIKIKLSKLYRNLFLAGLIFLVLGCFPYLILGHVPSFSEWNSRHQLLMPLGFSVLISAIIFGAFYKFRILLFSLIISISFYLNIKTYFDFYIDWDKQQQLISLFKENIQINNSSYIAFQDNSISQNAIDRIYRSYEWNGLLFEADRSKKRIGINSYQIEKDSILFYYPNYKIYDNVKIESSLNWYYNRILVSARNDYDNFLYVEINLVPDRLNYKKITSIFESEWSILPKYNLKVFPVVNNIIVYCP